MQDFGSEPLGLVQLQGLAVGSHRARTLMRSNGLRVRWRCKFVHTTDSRDALTVAADVLARQFNPETPNRAWVGDITEFTKSPSECTKKLDHHIA